MGLFKIFKKHLKKHRQKKSNAAQQILKRRRAKVLTKKQNHDYRTGLSSQSASNVEQVSGRSSLSAHEDRSSGSKSLSGSNSVVSKQYQSSVQSSIARSNQLSSASESQERVEQSVHDAREQASVAKSSSEQLKIAHSESTSELASSQSVIREQSLASNRSSSNQSIVKSSSIEPSSARNSSESLTKQSKSKDRSENTSKTYARGLAKSRSTFGQKLNALFANFRSVDDNFFDELEDTLIESDVGFNMAIKISDALRKEVKLKNVKKRKDVQDVIIKKMIDLYDADGKNEDGQIHYAKKGPTVFLFVGVNGAGKTTTIGKMAHMYHQQGKKVLLAAADTFRAGAIEQLNDWAKLDQVDIVKKKEHSDPSSVVYDAVHKAKNEHYDILFVDTAGRLQNKINLMHELAKMKKVITRTIPKAPQEVMLVLDATTGQNALSQAKLFKQVTNVTGIVLTKLDGTAKGGIILAIRDELHLPVKYVGLGERVTDLKKFSPSDFIYGLFAGLFK